MPLISKNPYTQEVVKTYPELTDDEIESKLEISKNAFEIWKNTSFEERASLMKKVGEILRKNARKYGEMMTLEMGKPIKQAVAESEKCAWVCDYYAQNSENILTLEYINTGVTESFVRFDPIGPILAIMPWNYPFWQVFRFLAPALMAGNVGLLKHASNVPGCALLIEEILIEAGFPKGVFQILLVGSSKVEQIIEDERIKATTLTGSESAGRSVASISGKNIKKTVMELGGSDPYIVLSDADIDEAVNVGVIARLQNVGQTCIAAKRFIIEESIYDEFLDKFKIAFEAQKIGNPMEEDTVIGPMYAESGLKDIENQVILATSNGAKVITGGQRIEGQGFFYPPTILTDISKSNPIYYEELFGPVAMVFKVSDENEAIKVANDSPFGLGASLWTQDLEKGKKLAKEIEAGCVFINGQVKSDPRLPFGGIKNSGFGRELGSYGIKEFVNIKTVVVK